MKLFAALAIAVTVLAADPAPETGPNFNETSRRELPYPLPADFDECIHVTWSAESRKKLGERGGFWFPPHSAEDIASINAGMRNEWGTYSRCTNEGA